MNYILYLKQNYKNLYDMNIQKVLDFSKKFYPLFLNLNMNLRVSNSIFSKHILFRFYDERDTIDSDFNYRPILGESKRHLYRNMYFISRNAYFMKELSSERQQFCQKIKSRIKEKYPPYSFQHKTIEYHDNNINEMIR